MLYSIYPTDSPETVDEIARRAASGPDGLVFTSLHIPEASRLTEFGELLTRLHREQGLTFCADISPAGLDSLGVDLVGIGMLREWGVTTLRADYGFSGSDLAGLAGQGFAIAVNASTVSPDTLDAIIAALAPEKSIAGWHNYYPRPETGLEPEYFARQCALFTDRDLPVYSFLPGERSFRGPMHLGLPTLESHRHAGAYVAAVQTLALCPSARLVVAEGTLLDEHDTWIRVAEGGITTLPLACSSEGDAIASTLLGQAFGIRVDSSSASFRLEGTRGGPHPSHALGGANRRAGSLYVDLDTAGRYAGEIHLIRRDLDPSPLQCWVADIASPYAALVDALVPGARIRFPGTPRRSVPLSEHS